VALRISHTGAITSSPRVRSTRATCLPTNPFAPESQILRGPDPRVGSAVAGAVDFERGRGGFAPVGAFAAARFAGAFVRGDAGLGAVVLGVAGLGVGGLVRHVRGRGSVMPSAPGAATDQ